MKKFLFLNLFLAILVGGVLYFWPFFQLEFSEIKTIPTKIANLVEKEILAPPPLRAGEEKEIPGATLRWQEVIEWTNIQRKKYNTNRAPNTSSGEGPFAMLYAIHKKKRGINIRIRLNDHTHQVIFLFFTHRLSALILLLCCCVFVLFSHSQQCLHFLASF